MWCQGRRGRRVYCGTGSWSGVHITRVGDDADDPRGRRGALAVRFVCPEGLRRGRPRGEGLVARARPAPRPCPARSGRAPLSSRTPKSSVIRADAVVGRAVLPPPSGPASRPTTMNCPPCSSPLRGRSARRPPPRRPAAPRPGQELLVEPPRASPGVVTVREQMSAATTRSGSKPSSTSDRRMKLLTSSPRRRASLS